MPRVLNFTSRDVRGAERCFTLSILQDTDVEFEETFILTVSEEGLPPLLSLSNSSLVTIIDDDGNSN